MNKVTQMRVTQKELDHMKARAVELGGVGHHGMFCPADGKDWGDVDYRIPKCLGGFLADANGIPGYAALEEAGTLMNSRGFSWQAFDFALAGGPRRVPWERIEEIVDFVIIPEPFIPDPRD